MKRSRCSEKKYAVKQAESGMALDDVCRQMGIIEATFYVWKKRPSQSFGTLLASAAAG
jgi:putative transposase